MDLEIYWTNSVETAEKFDSFHDEDVTEQMVEFTNKRAAHMLKSLLQ